MFGTKSGLRFIATIAAAAVSITLLGASPALAKGKPTPSNSGTLSFLSASFEGGKALPGFSPGTSDFGFTMEALLQRYALGDKSAAFKSALAYNLQNPNLSGSFSTKTGFLFNSDGSVKYGLAGKFAFVSRLVKADNASLRKSVLTAISKSQTKSGDLTGDYATTFDRSWAILGLVSNGYKNQARALAAALVKTQLSDGGFNDGWSLNEGSADGTGIALQALASVKGEGTSKQRASIAKSIKAAAAWLRGSAVGGDHWESWGDYNVNGTAYAAMGLKASGASISSISAWLRGKLASDGGLQTSWSGGAGDIYATAQSVTPMLGKSYLDLLNQAK